MGSTADDHRIILEPRRHHGCAEAQNDGSRPRRSPAHQSRPNGRQACKRTYFAHRQPPCYREEHSLCGRVEANAATPVELTPHRPRLTLGRPSGTKSRHDGLTARVLGLVRRPAPFGCRRCCNTNTSKITDLWRFTSGLSVSRPTDPGSAGIPDGKQEANILDMPYRKGIAAVQSTPLLRHHPCFLRCQLTITAAYPASRRKIPMRTTPISTWA